MAPSADEFEDELLYPDPNFGRDALFSHFFRHIIQPKADLTLIFTESPGLLTFDSRIIEVNSKTMTEASPKFRKLVTAARLASFNNGGKNDVRLEVHIDEPQHPLMVFFLEALHRVPGLKTPSPNELLQLAALAQTYGCMEAMTLTFQEWLLPDARNLAELSAFDCWDLLLSSYVADQHPGFEFWSRYLLSMYQNGTLRALIDRPHVGVSSEIVGALCRESLQLTLNPSATISDLHKAVALQEIRGTMNSAQLSGLCLTCFKLARPMLSYANCGCQEWLALIDVNYPGPFP